jgi:hypothetical protein
MRDHSSYYPDAKFSVIQINLWNFWFQREKLDSIKDFKDDIQTSKIWLQFQSETWEDTFIWRFFTFARVIQAEIKEMSIFRIKRYPEMNYERNHSSETFLSEIIKYDLSYMEDQVKTFILT